MTPAARVQAAIELLDQIIAAARDAGAAADTLIARYFAARRYAGSKDRRAVRDLVYAAIRRAGERPVSGRAAMVGLAGNEPGLAALFDGSTHAPAPIDPADPATPAGIAPAWLSPKLMASIGREGLPALLERAPLDLRVNRLRGDRPQAMALLPEAVPTPHAADGLRLPEGFRVEASEAWVSGLVEVQDEGSQLIVRACAVRPGMTVVDLCAGAGGKTLALAADMANAGRLIASDSDAGRLGRLAPRADRAGATIVERRLLDPGREAGAFADLARAADVVLVDAPCSGTGTWRRNPESRWRLTPDRLARLTALQARLFDLAAGLVRPGGILVYAVCSLLAEEGERQATGFLARHSGWVAEPDGLPAGRPLEAGRLLTPARDGTDGFFIARLRAP
jgi:16S rRNA (cytosine967-C5)-methyltransferase